MSVEMTLVLFLLCSGFSHFTFASNRLRVLRLADTTLNYWLDVSSKCNETGESYVTLYEEEDEKMMKSYMKPKVDNKAWVGLHKGRNITWSNGEPATFQNISADVSNGEQLCVAIDTKWEGFNCSERKPFMCNNGSNYTLIESKKTWCQALQYCRIHFVDLASINDDTQNKNAIKAGKNTSFWIGLMLDEWEWEDGSCSSFRKWYPQSTLKDEGEIEEIYALSHPTYDGLFKRTEDVACSLCSKGNMRIRVSDRNLTWEQAFDYCKANHNGLLWINDADDQKAVEQWLELANISGPFWIGLRQSRVFGFWIWSDRMANFSNWKNDTQPELLFLNHCGAINQPDGMWSDENCLDLKPFLCEEEIVFMNKSRMVHSSSWL